MACAARSRRESRLVFLHYAASARSGSAAARFRPVPHAVRTAREPRARTPEPSARFRPAAGEKCPAFFAPIGPGFADAGRAALGKSLSRWPKTHPSIWLLVSGSILPILPFFPPGWVVLAVCSLWNLPISRPLGVIFGANDERWVRRAEKNFFTPEIFVEVFFLR